MIKQIQQVLEFHKSFNSYYKDKPGIPDLDTRTLRKKLISEEFYEVDDENMAAKPDIEKVAKELADLIYVINGTIVSYGLQDKFEAIFDEVHRSNMSKLGSDGRPVYRDDGKILKPDTYSPADLKPILND